MAIAVLLAAGRGTRLWPLTENTPKVMVRILGKPLLEYMADGLARWAEKIAVVISPGNGGEAVKHHFANSPYAARIKFCVQGEQRGTAHAVLAAEKEIGSSDFVVLHADTFFSPDFFPALQKNAEKKTAFIVGKRVGDASSYGLLQTSPDGFLQQIVEKPVGAKGGLVNTGAYYAPNEFLSFLKKVRASERGELEATQALSEYASRGKVRVVEHEGYWNDVGYYWNYLDTNAFALEHLMRAESEGTVEQNVTVHGRLFVGKGAVVKSGTYVEGPVYIGENCSVGPGAYLRPYAFLEGENHVGNSSEIKNSVLLRGASAPHLNYVADSIVCEDVNLGAGTITANLRFDEGEVHAEIKGARVASGKRKLGAVIGAGAKTGVNSSINCGTLIGANARIYPHALVTRNVASNETYRGER